MEMEAAKAQLSTEVISNFHELFQNINNIHHNTQYTFEDDAAALLQETIDQFVAKGNEAIQDDRVLSKSKTPELIPCLSTALPIFNQAMCKLLTGIPSMAPPTKISKSTLENASAFVRHLQSQKEN